VTVATGLALRWILAHPTAANRAGSARTAPRVAAATR
jgi:hypothetical protein